MNPLQRSLIGVIAMIVLLTALSIRVWPQTAASPGSASVLTDLLTEVRGLRVAMERSSTIVPRMQLALARLNIKEQRTVHLYTQLEGIRRELDEVVGRSRDFATKMADVQRSVLTTTDPEVKRQLQYEEGELRRILSEATTAEEQLRLKEAEVAQLLRTEQDRWTDLNSRLDEMERLLLPPQR